VKGKRELAKRDSPIHTPGRKLMALLDDKKHPPGRGESVHARNLALLPQATVTTASHAMSQRSSARMMLCA